MSQFYDDEVDNDNGDNNVGDDHDGNTADGDAAGEINSSERYLTIDEQEQTLLSVSTEIKMFPKLSDN